MNSKITKTEFKKWPEELKEEYIALLKPSNGLSFPDQATEKQFIGIGAITSLYAGKGTTQAIFVGIFHLE